MVDTCVSGAYGEICAGSSPAFGILNISDKTMQKINFTKMNGLGNDFVILDYKEFQKTNLAPDI